MTHLTLVSAGYSPDACHADDDGMRLPFTHREPLAEVLEEYATHLRAGGARPRTVVARVGGVGLLGQSAGKDPQWASTQDVTRWLGQDSLKAWSRTTYYGHARAWFGWLVDTGRRGDDPSYRLKRPKPPRGVPRPLTRTQVADLLAATSRNTHLFVLLAAYAGLRVHEIAKIRGEDISAASIRVVGKGGHEAVIPCHPWIWAEASRRPAGYWFPSHAKEGHMKADSVSTAVRRALATIGIDGHAHQLRHHFGTEVLKAAGGNIRVAQVLLRHANISSTQIYTLVDEDDARAAVLALGA